MSLKLNLIKRSKQTTENYKQLSHYKGLRGSTIISKIESLNEPKSDFLSSSLSLFPSHQIYRISLPFFIPCNLFNADLQLKMVVKESEIRAAAVVSVERG
jgi:hypothetical protein